MSARDHIGYMAMIVEIAETIWRRTVEQEAISAEWSERVQKWKEATRGDVPHVGASQSVQS